MKRIVLSIVLLLVLQGYLMSQQTPLFNQYMMNDYLINPGIVGSVKSIPIRLQVKQQWMGIKGAPSTQILSAHGLVAPELGLGGYIFNDKFGPISSTGMQGSSAYHLKINESINLNFGASLALFQFKLDERELIAIEDNDVVLTGSVESKLVPDANFGMYFYSEKFFAGLSLLQMLKNYIHFSNQSIGLIELSRLIYVNGGYNFDIKESIRIQPSILLKGGGSIPFKTDINLKAFYKNNYWLGLSYRSEDSFYAMFGIKYQKYYFGYSVGFPFSPLKTYTHGCHEIILGIDINNEIQDSQSSF